MDARFNNDPEFQLALHQAENAQVAEANVLFNGLQAIMESTGADLADQVALHIYAGEAFLHGSRIDRHFQNHDPNPVLDAAVNHLYSAINLLTTGTASPSADQIERVESETWHADRAAYRRLGRVAMLLGRVETRRSLFYFKNINEAGFIISSGRAEGEYNRTETYAVNAWGPLGLFIYEPQRLRHALAFSNLPPLRALAQRSILHRP